MLHSSLCYLMQGNEYLLLHRTKKEHDINAGKWIGVGGKCEEGETPTDCMLREVKEEAGLTVTAYAYRGMITFLSDTFSEVMHLFTATEWKGKLHECDEGDLAWVDKEDMLSLPLWEGDRIFLHLLAQNHPFFCLTLHYQGDSLFSAVLDGKEIPIR